MDEAQGLSLAGGGGVARGESWDNLQRKREGPCSFDCGGRPNKALQRQAPRIKPITVSATVRNPPLIGQ